MDHIGAFTWAENKAEFTLTLSRGWWGRCGKKIKLNYLPKEEGREGGEKSVAAYPWGPGGLESGTYRMLGEGPQLNAMGVV